MFSINYNEWKWVCQLLFDNSENYFNKFLQLYPFSLLTNRSKSLLQNEDFFNNYIKSGLFFYNDENWFISDNYLIKKDGSYRKSSLVSPLMFLVTLAIGKHFYNSFTSNKPCDIDVFYSGSFKDNELFYKKQYNDFSKKVLEYSDCADYYLKIDIKEFFYNINIDKLYKGLFDKSNKDSTLDMFIYKELTMFLGRGGFPCIEQNIFFSYLATEVYLDDFDTNLFKFLKKQDYLEKFMITRYVDDLYIFIIKSNTEMSYEKIADVILDYCSSELKKIDLSINYKKTKLSKTENINDDISEALYNEYFYSKEFDIADIKNENILIDFTSEIEKSLENNIWNNSNYFNLIQSYFKIDDIEFNSQEIYRHILFNKQNNYLFENELLIKNLCSIIDIEYTFLKVDPKYLIIMLLKTKNEKLIKLFLSKLFNKARNEEYWSKNDSLIIVNYLCQRNFKNEELIDILKERESLLYDYITNFCLKPFVEYNYKDLNIYKICFNSNFSITKDDNWILIFLYFMYGIENKKDNVLSEYAYFKNYFDRMSSIFNYIINKPFKKISYHGFFNVNVLSNFYSDILDSGKIIETSHKLRNANPISHSSSEIINKHNLDKENLRKSIKNLKKIINTKCEEVITYL